jgi:hypothetical protein
MKTIVFHAMLLSLFLHCFTLKAVLSRRGDEIVDEISDLAKINLFRWASKPWRLEFRTRTSTRCPTLAPSLPKSGIRGKHCAEASSDRALSCAFPRLPWILEQ